MPITYNHLARSLAPRRQPVRGHGAVPVPRPGSGPAPALTYLICTNPRSGSWLLSEGLAATSRAGNPREWFNVLEEQQHRARWRMDSSTDLSYPAYLNLARALSTTSNGISGIKLHQYQLTELAKRMDVNDERRRVDAQALPWSQVHLADPAR